MLIDNSDNDFVGVEEKDRIDKQGAIRAFEGKWVGIKSAHLITVYRPAINANWGLWRFNRQIEKPKKTSKINHRPCPQKTAVTSKAARRRPPHDHRPRPVEVAFFRLFSSFFL